MIDRPIIFSASMVHALLAGRKTQTRRILKPQPPEWQAMVIDITKPMQDEDGHWGQVETIWSGPLSAGMCEPDREEWRPLKGLRYTVGCRLWVREAFSGFHGVDENFPPSLWPRRVDELWYWADGNPGSGDWTRPKPSIHMPRWASRLTLDVTDVRVQRLQDISEADALAEGIERLQFPECGEWGWPQRRFRELWGSLHGEEAWDANPWVAALTFTVERRNIDAPVSAAA